MRAGARHKRLHPSLKQYVGALVAHNYTAHDIRELLIQSCLVWCDTACGSGEIPEEERKETLGGVERRLRRMSLGMIVATLNNMLPTSSFPPRDKRSSCGEAHRPHKDARLWALLGCCCAKPGGSAACIGHHSRFSTPAYGTPADRQEHLAR